MICTAALATHLGHARPEMLWRELERVKAERIYEKRVFFVRNLGFITPSQARRISFEEAVRFERIHEETYREFGFEMVSIEPGSVFDRVSAIKTAVQATETCQP